jgi:hypothetical protein
LPDSVGSSGIPYATDSRYLNAFDWINGVNLPANKGYYLHNMQFNSTQYYDTMNNIQDVNMDEYYSYLNPLDGAEPMTNQNGWELMLLNLGLYPDGSVHGATSLQKIPYMLFYNRYTGILRVFAQYGYDDNQSAVKGLRVDLAYLNFNQNIQNRSGILRLGNGFDRTMDTTTLTVQLTGIAARKSPTNFWQSCDFQLTYDPCVCFYPTNLKLDFAEFSETNFELYGRAISIPDDLIDGLDILDNDFLGNVDYTSSNVVEKGGYIMYNAMSQLIDDYIDEKTAYQTSLNAVGEHNAEVAKNLKIMAVVGEVVKFGIGAVAGGPLFVGFTGELAQYIFMDTSAASKEKMKKLIGIAEKLLGKEVEIYLNQNLKTKPNPTKPTSPTATFTEMHFKGSLTTQGSAEGQDKQLSVRGACKAQHERSVD